MNKDVPKDRRGSYTLKKLFSYNQYQDAIATKFETFISVDDCGE
jgi:hypothetical protein